MKILVYGIPIGNAEKLVERIVTAAGEILHIFGVLQNVRIFMYWRCVVCIVAARRNFEHFL